MPPYNVRVPLFIDVNEPRIVTFLHGKSRRKPNRSAAGTTEVTITEGDTGPMARTKTVAMAMAFPEGNEDIEEHSMVRRTLGQELEAELLSLVTVEDRNALRQTRTDNKPTSSFWIEETVTANPTEERTDPTLGHELPPASAGLPAMIEKPTRAAPDPPRWENDNVYLIEEDRQSQV
jgi:hypothetical protein